MGRRLSAVFSKISMKGKLAIRSTINLIELYIINLP